MVNKQQWEENAVKKYGSIEKAKEEMRKFATLSKRNQGGTGGFASMDKDKLREVSIQAAKKRWNKS